MANAASTSNPSFIVNVGEAYPYPSLIAPNFVTVKLTGKNKYNLWETQMLCFLKSHQMYGFINGQFPSPAGNGKVKVEDIDAWIISDSLVKGWILGSISEEAATKALNHFTHMQKKTDFTAKDLWDELQRSYGPSVREQAAETKLTPRQAAEDAKSKDEPKEQKTMDDPFRLAAMNVYTGFKKKEIYKAIIEGKTNAVIYNLKGPKFPNSLNPWDELTNNGNTVLHVAVGSSTKNHELLKKLLEMTPEDQYTLRDVVNSDGCTLLHIAAIGGNIEAVNILVERNPDLLLAKDKEGHTPLALSISNMHTETSHCLFEHMKVHSPTYDTLSSAQKEKEYDEHFWGKSGNELVVLAISCQDFRLAKKIIDDYEGILYVSDAVLTALAQNFPRELNFWERGCVEEFKRIVGPYSRTFDSSRACYPLRIFIALLFTGLCLLAIVFYPFVKVLVRPFFEDTFQIHKDATHLLSSACWACRFDQYYNSTFEATRRNSSTFIRCFMRQFPDAIWNTNEEGHNFIQYSVINRSEKIYNLLYEMSEHKNIYKTIKDFSGNNLLHLAARLAPTNKLNSISGAALQIQRELQWFKEVEQFVCPLNRIQNNSDDETPEMVFTREHKDLVIEGENWIKKTAESYTITAALIITIVFAAAITVPGGNNQNQGYRFSLTTLRLRYLLYQMQYHYSQLLRRC